MFVDEIRLPLEKYLGNDIYGRLEGDILSYILAECDMQNSNSEWHFILQGHSFKAMPNLAPGLTGLFGDVVKKLGFTEPVEFYINNSPELNAAAIASSVEGEPHIININSGLIQMLTDQELRFVVGHELGHIISRNANISRLIRFVYPNPDRMPLLLRHKINVWQKFAELTADRYGFIANPDMASCISGFFKLSSGLNSDRIKLDYKAYLLENEEILARLREGGSANYLSHPINPIRIKAIQLFAESKLYKQASHNHKPEQDEVLENAMDELTGTLITLTNSALDYYRKQFVASAGLVLAHLDNEIKQEEYNLILSSLSEFTIFPSEYLQGIIDTGKVPDLMMEAISKILEISPSDRYVMFDMLMELAQVDKELDQQEIGFLFEVGTNMFGMNRKEIAQMMAANIQRGFVPDLYKSN